MNLENQVGKTIISVNNESPLTVIKSGIGVAGPLRSTHFWSLKKSEKTSKKTIYLKLPRYNENSKVKFGILLFSVI